MNEIELTNSEFIEQIQKIEQFLKAENKSAQYISELKRHLQEFLQYAEKDQIASIKDIDQVFVDKYLVYLEQIRTNRFGGLLKETTVVKHKISIRSFWKFLEKEEVKTNSIRVRHIRKNRSRTTTVLTHEEIQQLYSVCDTSAIGYRDRAMLSIYYGCGMRKSEGLRLVLSDFDFNKGRIYVRKSKNNRERYVIMSPIVQKHIEDYVFNYRSFYLSEFSTFDELFIGERGNPVSAETIAKRIEALWDRVKNRYGTEKQCGIHTLRHSLGTHLYMGKMDIQMIALMLGHRTLEATQLYIHSANTLKV